MAAKDFHKGLSLGLLKFNHKICVVGLGRDMLGRGRIFIFLARLGSLLLPPSCFLWGVLLGGEEPIQLFLQDKKGPGISGSLFIWKETENQWKHKVANLPVNIPKLVEHLGAGGESAICEPSVAAQQI